MSGTPILMHQRPFECLISLPSLIELTLDYRSAILTANASLPDLRRISYRDCAVTC